MIATVWIMLRQWIRLGALALLVWGLSTQVAQAVTCTSAATGNWNATGTWTGCTGGNGTPANTPGSADTVIIGNGRSVTVTAAAAASSISFASGNQATSLTLSGSNTLTVSGAITLTAPTGNVTKQVAVGAGTLTVGGLSITSGNSNRVSQVTVSTGTINVNGNITFAGTTSSTRLVYTGAGVINLTGNLGSGGTLTTVAGSVLNFNGTVGQTAASYTTYNVVKVNNAAGLTMSGTSTMATLTIGDVTPNSVFSDGGSQVTSTGTLNLSSGTLKLGAGTATTFPAFATRNIGAGTTVEYAATANQNVSVTPNYSNLVFSGASTKTALGALTVGGNLSISAGTLNAGTFTHSIAGNWTNNGTLTAGTSTIRLNGAAAQTIGGSAATTFNNLIIINTSGGVAMSRDVTVSGTLTLTSGTLSVGANTLTLNGPAIAGTLTNLSTTAASSLSYGGTSTGLAVPGSITALNNLTVNNANGVSLAGNLTLSGTLTSTTGALSVGANTLTLNGPAIAGAGAGTSLTTTTSSNLIFGGSAAGVSVPGSVTALNNLTVNNSNGISLGGSAVITTLNGTLALGANKLTTGSNTLSLATNCSANSGLGSLSRTSGFVQGNLRLTFLTGNSTCIYQVGDSTGYAPITVDMVGATAGTLSGRVDAGDHPDTTAAASGIDPAKSANHYWTLAAGTLTSFTSYSATFQFCANTGSCSVPAEVDAAATQANFIVARKNAGAWTTPSVGTLTSYSTQATGITGGASGFGEFSVGEVNLCFVSAFSGADGSAPGGNWSVGASSGTYGSPKIYSSRLRLTDASTSVSTWATLNRLIPAAGNKVTVEFDHFAYGGTATPGDGMAVVLSNASVSPVVGAFGGSLGYAQKSNPGSDCTVTGGCPGFAGGWLGIALDEYGNFSNPTEGRYLGTGQVVDSVAIRGSGVGVNGYAFIQGTSTLSPGVDVNNVPPGTVAHRYRIIVDNTVAANTYVSVERDTTSGAGTAYTSLIAPVDVKLPGYGQSATPNSFNLSFTGSSGASTNIHEIKNLSICTAQPLAAPSLNHIRIEHGGSACASTPANVTVKACADATCSSLYSGSVTVDLTPNAGGSVSWSPLEPLTFSGGSVAMTLTNSSTGTVTLGGNSTAPVVPYATRCFNGATETCALVFNTCTFDAVEVGAAAGTNIFTKLANVTFNLDAKRLGGNQTLSQLELVDATSGTCSTYPVLSAVSTSPTLPVTMNGGTTTQTFNFTYNNAAPNVRVRLTNSGGVKSCSSDNFAIRPQTFNMTSTATNSGSSGTPVFRAGEDSFGLTATAVYGGATTTTGYTGIPRLNASLITAPNPQALGNIAGPSFLAATSGVSTANLTYDEVGNLNFGQYAVYDDNFATVDSVKGECTPGFSNTLTGGKYSCQFGSVAAGPFGRFVPHHFTVTGTVSNACTAGGFTYMGQAFTLSPAGVVQARNKLNGVTSNYNGAYATGVVTFGAENADNGTNLGTSVVSFPSLAALVGTWSNGVFSLSNGTAVTFARPSASPSGPFDALDIGLTVADASVMTSPQVEGADMNPAAVGGTLTYKKFTGSPLKMRYGRLRLHNAFGSERLSLPMQWETQYWSGQLFARNTLDSCTSLLPANISLGMFTAPPGATAPLLSGDNLSAVTVNPISSGLGTLTLAPTAAATGSVAVLVNLGSGAGASAGGNCTSLIASAGPPVITAMTSTSPSSALPYLNGKWCGANYDQDPFARASFGVYKSPLIYRRENY